MDKIKQLLTKEDSKTSVNKDVQITIGLNGKVKTLPFGDINKVIDIGEQFNRERQNGSCYRILGTIIPFFTNVLSDLNNQTGLASVGRDEDEIKENLIEVDGWFGKLNNTCDFVELLPNRENFSLIPKDAIKNWDLYVTFPSSKDTTHSLVNNGLKIIDAISVVVGNRNMTAFITPVKHGLTIGERVKITGLPVSSSNKTYTVVRVGLDNGDLKEHSYVVDLNIASVSISSITRMKRVVSGQESEYYFRKFKKITQENDYETYPLAFGNTSFNDRTIQFVFNEDIDVKNLRDHLNRPISELYLTFVKKSNKGWGGVDSGLDVPFLNGITTNIPDIRRIHKGTTPAPHTPLETNISPTKTELYGDIVEYNKFQVKENILGIVNHRVNRTEREGIGNSIAGGPRHEGYIYNPHFLIKIRNFSTFVEQADDSVVDIPDYAEDLGDGRFLWRDLLDIGFSETGDDLLNYPFINGCHYMYNNYCLEFKRQDQFGKYQLFYNTPPRDAIGIIRDNDRFITNTQGDAC